MPASDAERIAAAQAYIDALVSHDGDKVPFAPGCTRTEVGMKTGFSGDHLRRSLNRGPQYRLIESTSVPEFTVQGDQVRVAQRQHGFHRADEALHVVFVVRGATGKEHLIPATREVVRAVDVPGRLMTIRRIAGLLEDEPDHEV